VAEESDTHKRYILIWLDAETSIDSEQLTPIRWQIEDKVDAPREEVEIDLWLESPGGDAHSAYKLALILRHYASHIRVVVPDYAKSAATLLALVGDEIYMAPGAELGPLDAQVAEEGSMFGAISALNIARASDEVARDAVALAMQGTTELVKYLRLGRVDALKAMLGFSAEFSEPLVRQLDPRLVHQANELLRVTVQYATRLLAATVGDEREAEEMAKTLVERFPTHGFVIERKEADDLGLPVRPIEDYDLQALVQEHHRSTEMNGGLICFASLDEIVGPEEEAEADEADDNAESREDGDHGERKALDPRPAAVAGADGHEARPKD
jgi:hypothetical protein